MITLRLIQPTEIEAAKAVMDTIFQGLWGITYAEIQAKYDLLEDVEHIQSYYLENGGMFLVLADDKRVIGIGGIGRLDDETAELKRIWLLKEYRRRGLGRKLTEALLEFARSKGYRRVRLMVATPDLQPEAVGLYNSLGFSPLPPDDPDEQVLFMEKKLIDQE